MPIAHPKPGKSLLTPHDQTLLMIDHQPQMAFATKSIDAITLRLWPRPPNCSGSRRS